MARGIPAFVATFGMTEKPELLSHVSYNAPGSNPFQESYLQWLLDSTPEILPIRDFYPNVISVCSLGREVPVGLGATRVGYIDNLMVTNTGHLVIVETKLHRNPEGIREVIAQTFEYGQAINTLSFLELEAALRKGMKGGNELGPTETIAARARAREADGAFAGVIEDFEDKLAANICRGEVLYLIVADGIHASVERMAYWLNEISGSAPHRFGLVELRSYRTADGRAVIIPRSLMRTKEVSRHVVVIESHLPDNVASATVEERTDTEGGATSITTRTVRTAGPLLTKDRLIEEVRSRDAGALDVVGNLLNSLDAKRFDSRALATELQFGLTFPPGDGTFSPIAKLTVNGLYADIPSRVVGVLSDQELIDYKAGMRAVAFFSVRVISPIGRRTSGAPNDTINCAERSKAWST